MIKNAEKIVRDVVRAWRPQSGVSSIVPLTPDASLRRYFRVHFDNAGSVPHTAVAMVFDSVASPEAGGVLGIASDEAYVKLTSFLSNAHIAVPELYYDARPDGVLLIEDAGDTLLAHALLGEGPKGYSNAEVEALYLKAIDQVFRIQRIPRKSEFFAYERSFRAETYIREMEELRDYSLASVALNITQQRLFAQIFQDIAIRLTQMPPVLCHRDYHPWNLMVCGDEVKVIDFQDALMATNCYDFVALLNDRDADAALGTERYNRLLQSISEEVGETSGRFFTDYALILLQRDLKVAGRFEKLVSVRKLPQYGRWIPGTQARISRSLRFLLATGSFPQAYRDFLAVLEEHLPVIASERRELYQGTI